MRQGLWKKVTWEAKKFRVEVAFNYVHNEKNVIKI